MMCIYIYIYIYMCLPFWYGSDTKDCAVKKDCRAPEGGK